MNGDIPDKIDPVRRTFRNVLTRAAAQGRLEPSDAALGALYATHDLAIHAGMDGHTAIEWMRRGANLMERQLLAADAARHG